jgi:hypothetical protein
MAHFRAGLPVDGRIHESVERHGGGRAHHCDYDQASFAPISPREAFAERQQRPGKGEGQGETECSNLIMSSVRRRRFQSIVP